MAEPMQCENPVKIPAQQEKADQGFFPDRLLV
jgi:hypothetical protein